MGFRALGLLDCLGRQKLVRKRGMAFGLLAHLAGGAQVRVGPLQGPPAAGDGVVGQAAVVPSNVPGVGLTQGRLDSLQVGWGEEDLQLTVGEVKHRWGSFRCFL